MSNDNRGFTLLEIVVAMGLLLIGVSSVLGLLSLGLALERNAGKKIQAGFAAENIAASLDEELFFTEPDGSVRGPAAIVEKPVPGYPGLSYSVQLLENPEDASQYLAEIAVQWKEKGKLRAQTFRTLVHREASFAQRMRYLKKK